MFVFIIMHVYAELMKKVRRFLQYFISAFLCLSALPLNAEADEASDIPPSSLAISALNAGYTGLDGTQQNWDFVELFNVSGEPVRLENYQLIYTNSSGNQTIHHFGDGAILNAEFLHLGYSSSPQFRDAESDYKYRFNLSADTGTISLAQSGIIIDEVCWGGAKCGSHYVKFSTKASDNLTLARCIIDGELELCPNNTVFEFRSHYPEPNFSALFYDSPEDPDDSVSDDLVSCQGIIFTEVFSYFENDYAEQFIELYNPTDEIIHTGECQIRYKNKYYPLSDEIYPAEYIAYRQADLKLTKNPTSENIIELIDADKTIAAKLIYPNGQKKATSYALFDAGYQDNPIWQQTYVPTPGSENIYQQFKTCPAGKVINPLTGNCINFFEEEALPDCPAGKFRNPETNRCKSYDTINKILEPCAEGYFRNPETNRCKKIATATTSGLKPCEEGYERNPETDRCRKIRENNGADYDVEPTSHSEQSSFIAYGALGVVVALGLTYVLFQFRHEIVRFVKKLLSNKLK